MFDLNSTFRRLDVKGGAKGWKNFGAHDLDDEPSEQSESLAKLVSRAPTIRSDLDTVQGIDLLLEVGPPIEDPVTVVNGVA